MTTVFKTITTFDGNSMDFEDLLADLQLQKVFGDLYAIYPLREKARKAVLYVLYAYSADSPLVTQGTSWMECKARAATKADLSEEMHNELVLFEFKYHAKEKALKGSDVGEIKEEDGTEEVEANEYNVGRIVRVINAYLNAQNDRVNKHLKSLYELYEQMRSAAVQMTTTDSKGTIDWKQKADCMKEANRLFGEIEEWEEKLKLRMANLEDGVKEVEAVKKKHGIRSLRPEII